MLLTLPRQLHNGPKCLCGAGWTFSWSSQQDVCLPCGFRTSWILTLGHRPRTDAGSSAPIFPIVIKCTSEANTLKFAELQKLLNGLDRNTATREEVASIFVRMPNDRRIDIPGNEFFAVWVGSGVGVYYDW